MNKYKQVTIEQIESIFSTERDERETLINIPRYSDKATIWTSDNTMMTRIIKRAKAGNMEFKFYEGNRNASGKVTGYTIEVPKKAISIRARSRSHKQLDEEEDFDEPDILLEV